MDGGIAQGSAIPTVTDGVVQQVPTSGSGMLDTSQPPPIRATQTPLLPQPNQLPMMPPGFAMPRNNFIKFHLTFSCYEI